MQHNHVHVNNSREQFPVKLYTMLELAEVQAFGCSGCSWLPHGRGFKIYDEREFMKVCIPMFFKQTKVRSFHRQLNLWGFKRLLKSVDAGAWYNEFFLRGAPEEMKKMVRIKIKGKGKANAKQDSTNKEEEPDFYRLPPLSSPCVSKPIVNRAGVPRRVSMEMGSMNTVPARKFQFNGSEFANPKEPHLLMQETTVSRCLSLPSLVPAVSATAPMQPLEEQYLALTSFQTSIANCQAASHTNKYDEVYVPTREFQFNGSEFASSKEPDLLLRETTVSRCVSLPSLVPAVPATAPMQPLEEQYLAMTPFQPALAGYQAIPHTNIYDIDEVKSRLAAGLEPLPFKEECLHRAENAFQSMLASRMEMLPVDDDIPFDEFASYIGDVIQTL